MLQKEASFSSMKEVPSQSKLHDNKTGHIPSRLEMYTVAGSPARALLMWFRFHQSRGWTGTRCITSKSLKCLDSTSESDRLAQQEEEIGAAICSRSVAW